MKVQFAAFTLQNPVGRVPGIKAEDVSTTQVTGSSLELHVYDSSSDEVGSVMLDGQDRTHLQNLLRKNGLTELPTGKSQKWPFPVLRFMYEGLREAIFTLPEEETGRAIAKLAGRPFKLSAQATPDTTQE